MGKEICIVVLALGLVEVIYGADTYIWINGKEFRNNSRIPASANITSLRFKWSHLSNNDQYIVQFAITNRNDPSTEYLFGCIANIKGNTLRDGISLAELTAPSNVTTKKGSKLLDFKINYVNEYSELLINVFNQKGFITSVPSFVNRIITSSNSFASQLDISGYKGGIVLGSPAKWYFNV